MGKIFVFSFAKCCLVKPLLSKQVKKENKENMKIMLLRLYFLKDDGRLRVKFETEGTLTRNLAAPRQLRSSSINSRKRGDDLAVRRLSHPKLRASDR